MTPLERAEHAARRILSLEGEEAELLPNRNAAIVAARKQMTIKRLMEATGLSRQGVYNVVSAAPTPVEVEDPVSYLAEVTRRLHDIRAEMEHLEQVRDGAVVEAFDEGALQTKATPEGDVSVEELAEKISRAPQRVYQILSAAGRTLA